MQPLEKYERIMLFSAMATRGIHREGYHEMLKSLFGPVYHQCWNVLKQILENNESLNGKKDDFDRLIRTEIQNVIAFTGRRGTGKTSVMVSVAAALDANSSNGFLKDSREYSILENNQFYVLPCIEAGALEYEDNNEKFLSVVISKMLLLLEKKINARKCTDGAIQKQANSIKEDIFKLFEVNKKQDSDYICGSPYEELTNTADRHNTRNNFARTVKKYLRLMDELENRGDNYYSNSKENSYLVIMIDDIDIAPDKSYDILQRIFQYFMIPNVIILTTFHVDTLHLTLRQAKDSKNNSIFTRNPEDEEKHFAQKYGVLEFLRKIIPADRRIVMPSWRKMDYRQIFPIGINIGHGGEIEEYGSPKRVDLEKVFPHLKEHSLLRIYSENQKEKDKILSPKELIFFMLADRTGVYLDALGTKKHFMEPESFRHLYDLFYFFYNMMDMRAYKMGTLEHQYAVRSNLKSLLDLLHFKMIDEFYLSATDREIFDSICVERFDRRNAKIVQKFSAPRTFVSYDNYSADTAYGQMLYHLYVNTRDAAARSKELVQAILADYSFTLPAVFSDYMVLQKQGNAKQIKEKKAELYRIFGSSQLGPWNGFLCMGENTDVIVSLSYTEITAEILCLLMLVPFDRIDEIVLEIKETLLPSIKFPIDLSAFVMNAFMYESFIEKVKTRFDVRDTSFLTACSGFYDTLKKYNSQCDYFALPLQHTDMYYNILKRAISKWLYRDDFTAECDRDKAWAQRLKPISEIIYEFFEALRDELESQDNCYDFKTRKRIPNPPRTNFTKRFENCPVVKRVLLNGEENGEFRKILSQLKRVEDKES